MATYDWVLTGAVEVGSTVQFLSKEVHVSANNWNTWMGGPTTFSPTAGQDPPAKMGVKCAKNFCRCYFLNCSSPQKLFEQFSQKEAYLIF